MATLDDVITVADLRAAIGAVGDTEDAHLTRLRVAAVSHIEKQIGRAVLSVSAWTSPPEAFEYQTVGGRLRFYATDIGTTGNLTAYSGRT